MFRANCELTLTENSMPTLRSSLDRSLGRILVPSRFQTSGVDLTNDETANFKRRPFRSGQLAKGTVQGSGEEIGCCITST